MPDILKDKMLSHWDALSRLSARRFHDPNLADEALVYVTQELEKDGWKRLRAFGGRSSFKGFLLQVSARLMEDFSRKKFGRVRPNKWIRDRGGIWVQLFKILCMDRMDDDWAVDVLKDSVPQGRSESFIRKAIITLKTRVPDCGKSNMPVNTDGEFVDDIPDGGGCQYTETPHASAEQRQRTDVMQVLRGIVEVQGDEMDGALSPLVDRLMETSSGLNLTTEDRHLLKLIYWEGLNTSAAGRSLGWTAAKTHGRLRTLLERIRQALQVDELYNELHDLTLRS